MKVRPETRDDYAAIRSVNEAAFETPAEAQLVEVLRERVRPIVSLVAEVEGAVVGHILFSPVALATSPEAKIMGLAPMAVLPERQGQGIGSALVRAGLEECRRQGFEAVVVLGHAGYYPRFGFTPARSFGLGCPYEVPEEVFMAIELQPGALDRLSGTVRYDPSFDEW